MFEISIAAIFKNEGPYILEWIAAHKALGVDHFYIADNGSVDRSDELLHILDKNGIITKLNFEAPMGKSPQISCYEFIVKNFGYQSKWLAFVDADEIICPVSEIRSLKNYVTSFDEDNTGILALNWAIYGSSNNEWYESGYVVDRFINRADQNFSINRHYKPILKTAAFLSMCGTTHDFNLKDGYLIKHIDGSPLSYQPRKRGISDAMIWEPFRLNHYLLKSKEEFTLRKSRNGDAAVLGRSKGRSYFVKHNKNEVLDAPFDDFREKLNEEYEKLTSLLKNKNFVMPDFSSIFDRKAHIEWLGKDVPVGHLDNVLLEGGVYKLYGWATAIGWGGVKKITLVVNDVELSVNYQQMQRKDVNKAYAFIDSNCGFFLKIEKSIVFEAIKDGVDNNLYIKIHHHDGVDVIGVRYSDL